MLKESFYVGWLLQYINRGIKEDYNLFGDDYIYDNLQRIDNSLDQLGLSDRTKSFIKRLRARMDKYKDAELTNVPKDDKDIMQNIVQRLYSTIDSELNSILIFNAVKECTLDKDCLIKLSNQQKSAFFDDTVWDKHSDLAKSDFSDAAKCILMGASTPAAMISLRASEDTVRHYYNIKSGEDPGEKSWGALVTELKKVPDIKAELIEHLDYIRKTRRNLAAHPDKIYSQREAERIFMDVVSMVHDIYEDIE